ncbi:MAG TPA: UDP-N-acetylglucosamine 1-carboxyvinyltransferase [Bacillota bacterium]|nr:UDP-N-acetylglucosamine 1-carboxyvinyltransferase [Clostridia bacterium]HNR04517.1 UDP-N-acetylglucosamine 1-carboxyvinyltransferase [Bacillota bacterium]HNT03861.1 UDP-N-acetylglucosamine 1-carboxyvinyltransferase [Bacillota bacterium]HNU79169.1 UDP-N-acetylglucosamine 1-carboxyvinyltransferase [Bacillota bacterium]HOH88650.1 UDP-N-acetylglucosamine 1-carboxyvinyltransferase [Bacillota bacterium]
MDKYVIIGGRRLEGDVRVDGSKNSILPVLAATIISGKESVIHNVPELKDVDLLIGLLRTIGCRCFFENNTLVVKSNSQLNTIIPEKPVREMRSSIILMGAMLARHGHVKISYPGGCEIGPRPIDIHLSGLRRMGTKITEAHGYINCECDRLKGVEINLDYPSVGATENIMLAATTAEGVTIIQNAAKEPEIVDLQNFLNGMGARISGAGTSTVKIEGVKEFHDVEHTVIPDRIVAGTLMAAAAITGGNIVLNDVIIDHLKLVSSKLSESGCSITEYQNSIQITCSKKPKAVEVIKTLPYPGFATDMQAQMMAVMTIAKGTSIFIETVFESRYKHVEELMKMGANIKVDGRTAVVRGVKKLTGTEVKAGDLRGGAALVLAGLAAEGTTVVDNVKLHIDRGYDKLENKLAKLGADIHRV